MIRASIPALLVPTLALAACGSLGTPVSNPAADAIRDRDLQRHERATPVRLRGGVVACDGRRDGVADPAWLVCTDPRARHEG